MISETRILTEIFEDFVGLEKDIQENELWKSNSIIKLMQVPSGTENTKIIETVLKNIINLCQFKECGRLLDSYEKDSSHINDLIESDRPLFDSILQAEFI